jgi:hypothetical protein
MRVLGDMMPSTQRPQVLLHAVREGRVPVADLPELIAFAWLRDDSPTSGVSESDWTQIFKSLGFFSYPLGGRSRPTAAVEVFRGTTADRLLRMSWADDRNVALQLGRRHAWHGPAALYSATVEPAGVLAYLGRQGEGWTVVVDTARIEDLQLLERLPDPRPAVQLMCN